MNRINKIKQLHVLSEEHFSDVMDREVIPFLSGICQSGYLSLPSGQGTLYYESYCPADARGVIVISHGFCESIEKYKEVIYYFVKAGFQVHLADHRGHGRSLRETTHPNMVHITEFRDYVNDLHALITNIIKPTAGKLPLYLYAHSMGGAIGALYLETYPQTFTKAILTSPMLAIYMGPIPAFVGQALGWFMVKLHRDQNYAPGQHEFHPDEKWEDSGSSCEARFRYYQTKKEAEPKFQNCGSSYGWAYTSLCACHSMTQKKNCDKITVPVLVFQSPNDTFIKASGISRFIKNTPSAELIQIPDSRHEIYNSASSVIEKYYQTILAFLI